MNSCLQIRKSYCYYTVLDLCNSRVSDIYIDVDDFDKNKHGSLVKLRNEKIYKDLSDISQNQKVIVACIGTDVIGHLCMKPSGNGSQGRIWKGKDYIHYGFVSPDYRGHNIYPMLLSHICTCYFKEFPQNKIYISTGINNIAAQKSFDKVGFIKYATQYECYICGHRVFSFVHPNPTSDSA